MPTNNNNKRRVAEGAALLALGVGIGLAIDKYAPAIEEFFLGETLQQRRYRQTNERYMIEDPGSLEKPWEIDQDD